MNCCVCGLEGPDKFTTAARQWNWFTGYLPETVHFCPDHKGSDEKWRLWLESRKKPEVLEAV